MQKAVFGKPITIGNKTVIPLKCQACGHEWLYQGQGARRTSCPSCSASVTFPRREGEGKRGEKKDGNSGRTNPPSK